MNWGDSSLFAVVNECMTSPGVCGKNSSCATNQTDGSAMCSCLEKFVNVAPGARTGLSCGTIDGFSDYEFEFLMRWWR